MSETGTFGSYPIVMPLFVGGAGDEVTGSSCILKIETSDMNVRYIMVDCGAIQGENEYWNYEYPVKGDMLDAVILTHAHYDHVGELALLYKNGFRGKIYVTSNAMKLSMPILIDSANLQANAGKKNALARARNVVRLTENRCMNERHFAKKYRDMKELDSQLDQIENSYYEPLYTQEDVRAVAELFCPVKLYNFIEIEENIKIRMLPSTHQNGAIRLEVIVKDPNGSKYGIAFSGDIGSDTSLLYERKCDYTSEKIDAFVLEALHGTKKPVETLDESIQKLFKILKKAKNKRKKVVLMGYSLDRNAKLVYLLNEFRKKGFIIDCLIDSPLTLTELEIYKSTYEYDKDWFKDLGHNPFSTDDFRVIKSHSEHVEATLHQEGPCAIVTASANGNGGRVVGYFQNGLQSDKFVFVVCGWVPPESVSRRIIDANKGDIIELQCGTFVKHCETHWLHGFSSHGYCKEMITAVNDYPNLQTLFLNHARLEDKIDLRERIMEFFGGRIYIPNMFSAYKLTEHSSSLIDFQDVLFEYNQILDEKFFQVQKEDED